MKIFTSYFAGYKGGNGVSIARSTPIWFKGESIIEFAPPYYMIHYPEDRYIIEFQKQVLLKTAKQGLLKLRDGMVLLCYEKPNQFCHRHLIAEWLRSRGIEAEEWQSELKTVQEKMF
jgi:hypothetical protein